MCGDAQNPNEYEEDVMGENVRIGNSKTDSNGRRFKDTPLDFATTMRILRVEMQSHKVDKEILVKALEEQNQLNASMLQSLTEIQRRMNSRDQTVRPKGIRALLEEEIDLLVVHLTLKDPLVVQALLLMRIRERGATRTIHVMNLRRQGLLPSTVR